MTSMAFYHPDRGYWETDGIPDADLRAAYPDGTVEVPFRPSDYHQWQGGAWVEFPPPAPTADDVRATRDQLLAESDWTQVADAPVDQTAWATYRQALRDIPQQAGFPENVTWPDEPNG